MSRDRFKRAKKERQERASPYLSKKTRKRKNFSFKIITYIFLKNKESEKNVENKKRKEQIQRKRSRRDDNLAYLQGIDEGSGEGMKIRTTKKKSEIANHLFIKSAIAIYNFFCGLMSRLHILKAFTARLAIITESAVMAALLFQQVIHLSGKPLIIAFAKNTTEKQGQLLKTTA